MLSRMKLANKIALALGLVVTIAVAVGCIGYWKIGAVGSEAEDLGTEHLTSAISLLRIHLAQMEINALERSMLIPGLDKATINEFKSEMAGHWNDAEKEDWVKYDKAEKSDEEKKLWADFQKSWDAWKEKHAAFMEYVNAGRLDKARTFAIVEDAAAFEETETIIDSLMTENAKFVDQTVNRAGITVRYSKTIMLATMIIGLLLSVLSGVFFERHIRGIIDALITETRRIVEAAVVGKLDARGDGNRINDEFQPIMDGINDVIDTMVGHLDNMPLPVMIIDKEMDVRYMNKAGAGLLGLSQQQLLGTKCYDHFKTSDCHTSNCACATAMRQRQLTTRETDAHPRGMNLNISYTGIPIKDANDKVVGCMEFVVDQTGMMSALKAQKQAAYQEKEVEKLIVNLGKLAKGDLRVETEVAETDEDTRAVGENFHKINTSLGDTVQAVNLMAVDANMLAQEAVEGKLNTRVDASRHGGEYRNIVEGINRTLDAVVHPISEAAECLKEMARGNMNVAMTGDYKGDHAIIKNALNSTIDSINEILGQVEVAVDQVANGSRQISDSSQALSQGASESASTLEEITSSMEQVTAQTKNTADNATHANQLADQARQSAEKGNGRMMSMVEAMNEINESAADISKIIKAIDEIAFQTNLLALNAAVEAARAGKHGKGFAVVAEEVRNLAERSARAAKETAELIEGSIKKTEAGTRIVEETSKALEEIVAGATKVTDLIGEIASASKEQALGIGQINQGLGQVDQVVQQNTASAEELAASSEELSAQALQLKQMLGRFQLKAQRALQAQGVVRKAAGQARGKGMREAAAAADAICLDDQEFGDF
ncbi:MAG: methyl-accepting chemotaxis protein [Bacillota bacterium]